MDNHNLDELNFETKHCRVYYLSAILVAISIIQWSLLVNFAIFEFLLNYWLVLGAYITFFLIVIVYIATNLNRKTLPAPVGCIFAVLIAEIINICLGITIVQVNNLVLYCSLSATIIFVIILLSLGRTIKRDHFSVIALVVFSFNVLFIILNFGLMIVAKFLPEFYVHAFLTTAGFYYLILIANTLYIAILIRYNRHESQSLTNCLNLALYVHAVFGAFLWLCLSLAIEIMKIRASTFKNSL